MKNILIPVVNRTNYTKQKLVIEKLSKHFSVSLLPSSATVVQKYGDILQELYDRDYTISSEIDCLMANDTLESMCKTCGLSIIEHSSYLKNHKPDGIVVVGDRFDMFGIAFTAFMMGIKTFHIQGGEKSGCVDDTIRDMISLCSARHYVATELSKQRVVKLTGTDPSNVLNFGCPAVEMMCGVDVGDGLDVHSLNKRYKNDIPIAKGEDYFITIVHPNTSMKDDIIASEIIKAILHFDTKTIIIYPNIDAFNSSILNEINKNRDKFILLKHCPVEDFAKFMAHAKCMIGNSSAGIREAASCGTPVVNIGSRQQSRERNGNIFDCSSSFESVVNAIQTSITSDIKKENIYYKPNASLNIAEDIRCFMEAN